MAEKVAVAQPTARRQRRRDVVLPGFALLEDGTTCDISIVDLSYDGCKIETAFGFVPGKKIKLSVLRLGCLPAQVRWSAAGKVGLCFAPDASFEREEIERSHERMELAADVSLRRSGRFRYQGRTFDVSPSGCKVEFVELPRTDDLMWVKFDGLEPIEARVRWVEGFTGGVEFVRPIYPAVFELLMTRLKQGA